MKIIPILRMLMRMLLPRQLVSTEIFCEKIMDDIKIRIARNTPAQSLRLLLTLDNRLYNLEGPLSGAYDNGVHTKHRHTRYHDFFVNRLSSNETVLDIGCGNGFLAFDMASRGGGGVIITAIDLSAESIAVAKERFAHPHINYLCGNALTDLPGGNYETVVLSNVLEHLPERPAFLRKIQNTIKPRRYLIRAPLFERDWRVPLKKELGLDWRLDSTHETEYTLESFAEEMASANLLIIHQEVRWGEIWCETRSKDAI